MRSGMTNDEIARLFAEHDDFGADSSIWLRLITRLLTQGKPLGEATVVCVDYPGQGLPLGAFASTDRDRLIFWPVLPRDMSVGCRGRDITIPHHITLEFPSGRIHATAYNERGTAVHRHCGRLQRIGDSGFSIWTMLVVERSVLDDQDEAVQRKVQTPVTDKPRREAEFRRFASKLSVRSMPMPASDGDSRCLCCAFYVVDEGVKGSDFDSSLLLNGGLWDKQVEGWPEGHRFMIVRFLLQVGTRRVLLAACCCPGKPRSKVGLGFPNAPQPARVAGDS